MSKSIDERIVDMQFNNRQFESGIKESLGSLDKLKKGLDLDGASRGLTELSDAGRRFSLAGIAEGIDTIAGKFTTLGIIGITAIQNIVNSAVNAGKKIVSALTIDPIMTGFSEYETKINSVQTILANTSSKQETVSKKAIESINTTAQASLQATAEANEKALDNLSVTHKQQVKEYTKLAKAELDVVEDKYDTELEALNKAISEENKILKKAHEEKLDSYQSELDALGDKYDEEFEALSKAISAETKLLNEAHKEKLDLYNEEYLEKLKIVDEDRYNKIKAIEAEIDSINALTKAEDEEIKRAKQQEKLAELAIAVRNAKSEKERQKAEQRLAEYKEELSREALLKERNNKIKELKDNKDTINEEYKLRVEEIKQEYADKKKSENELYALRSEILKEDQAARKKALKDIYETEKKLLNDKKKAENELYELQSEILKEDQAARKKTLKDIYETEKDFIKDKQENEKDALAARQTAEIEAMRARSKMALANIEVEKKAQLKALTEVKTASTEGSTLEDVNRALDELNKYADKTIYNFTEMTRNIGTFTAAGVDLETSVSAIKGIANLAAVSGSTSQQASTAMYQLSQALASGTVKLQDWNSVVNAGMGGKVFQDALKETARVHGIAIDMMIAEEGSFRQTLQKGWLTSEILTETLSKFTGDLNEEQLRTMGYTEEQIKSIIKMGQTANDAATKVKTFTQLFDTLKEAAQSGWTESWEIVIGDFEEAKELLTELSDVFGGFIGRSADARNTMLQFWKDNGGRDALIESFKNAFEALNMVLKPIGEAFHQIFPPMTGERLVAMTKALKSFTERIKIGEETVNNIKRTFAGFFAILSIGKQAISAIIGGISRLFKILAPGAGSFLGMTAGVGDWLVALEEAVKKGDIFNKAIQSVADVIGWVVDKVGKGITALIDFFTGFNNVDLSGVETFTDKVRIRFEPFSALFGGIGKIFSNTVEILKKVAPLFYKLASMIGKGIMSLQDKILEALDNGNFTSILDLINTGLLGALILGIKKFVDSMSDVTGGFAGILDGVKGSLEAWQSSLKAGVLLKIAISIGILAAALAVLASIDSDKLTGALVAITTLFAELFGSMAIFSKFISGPGMKGITKMAFAMVGVSLAVLILASAMKKLSDLDWEGIAKGLVSVGALMAMLIATTKLLANTEGITKGSLSFILFAVAINILASAVEKLGAIDIVSLGKGLLAVGVLMTELALFMKATDLNKMGIAKGLGILLLATSMTILASAVKKLGEIDLAALAKGLGAMGVILVELGLFINATPDAKRVISTAVGLVILGAAMLIFASAIEKMGNLSLEQIGKGLLTMAGALTIITVALNLMPKNMVLTGASLILVASALVILSKALETMGGMTWEEIAKGLVVLAGSLTIIAVAMMFMTGALPGAAAMLVVAGALAILAPVLKTLGSMSLSEIGKGLLALAGVFAVIGVAGLLLAPLTPVILGLAAAIALFGIGCLAVGAGMLAFSAGLTALAIAGTAGTAALVAIVTAIIGLIPFLLEQIGYAIIAFAGVITEGMPAIMEAIEALFSGLIKLIGELAPPLILTVLEFILELLTKLVEYVPQFVDAGMKIIIGFLEGIANNIAGVVKAGIDIILNFLNGIRQKLPDVIDMGFKLIISFINGLAYAIRNNHKAIYDAVENLIDAIIDAIKSFLGRLPKIGGQIVSGLIDGIVGMGKSLVDAAKGVVSGAIDGAKKLLGIKSPSRVFKEIGENTGKGMVIGLEGMSDKVGAASEQVGNSAVDSMTNALGRVQDVLDSDVELQPTIRPVIDMTDVQSGINSTFRKTQSLNVSGTTSRASSVASGLYKKTSVGNNSSTAGQNGGEQGVHNEFKIASLVVREEADVKRVARQLYQLQLAGNRG